MPFPLAAALGAAGMFLFDPQQGARRRALLRELSRPSDARLEARVRARLGRFVSHPRAIQIAAQDGEVLLLGPVLSAERQRLVRAVHQVRGVQSVEDHLAAYESADSVPALQGVEPPQRRRWPRAMRVFCAAGAFAAAALFARALRRRGPRAPA
jgi:hypothetical protein